MAQIKYLLIHAIKALRVNLEFRLPFLANHTSEQYVGIDAEGKLISKSSGVGNAEDTNVDTTNFDGILSPLDDTVQKALDTIDDHDYDGGTW